MPLLDVDTPHGPARVHLHEAGAEAAATVVLGHGAGGSVDAPDLRAAASVATDLGLGVALVEQPYRVAGRRVPAPAHQLDRAWTTVVGALREQAAGDLAVIAGGRSSGARVACRTAASTGAVAVLCLAFPLRPPRRSPAAEPKSRQPELDAVAVPVLVVQGVRDPFGVPASSAAREVVAVPGTHTLRSAAAIDRAVRPWLTRAVAQLASAR